MSSTPQAATGAVARQHASRMPVHRYQPYTAPFAVDLPDRRWPGNTLAAAPRWCSVDLRDGNQALVEPMSPERKLRMFALLVRMGYKEIEVGFPSAGRAEFDFVRLLVEHDLIPDDVTIQVMTQCREHLIDRTFESLRGAHRAIVHFYNSTSALQRRVVFGLDRAGITAIATDAARLCRTYAELHTPGTDIHYEYSPESYTGTELDYALDICAAVIDVIDPTPDRPLIVNLPATVEMATPNVFADSVEWMHRRLPRRESLVLSLHPHNDRGTAVAATELGLLAGAERVEGCLFGNGERTGNVDLVTLGLNLFTHGIDPQIEFGDIDAIRRTVEVCNGIPVHARHPYAGDLVHTSFSGSHQDAIKKGFDALERDATAAGVPVGEHAWGVPYLPLDPRDIGRSYEAVVRVNAQSGKGGVAYVLKAEHQLDLPRPLQVEFAAAVQDRLDRDGGELTPARIRDMFVREYVTGQADRAVTVSRCAAAGPGVEIRVEIRADAVADGTPRQLIGTADDPVDALVVALAAAEVVVTVRDRVGHPTVSGGAVAYVEAEIDGTRCWGVGIADTDADTDAGTAELDALVAAVNRALRRAPGPPRAPVYGTSRGPDGGGIVLA